MILISAGHHAARPGACFNGFCEHDEALRWVDQIVGLIGDNALAVPAGVLREKVAFINARHADLAVEIHFNSAAVWKDKNQNGQVDEGEIERVGKGSETLYYPSSKKGKIAAETVQEAIGAIFEPSRGAKEGWFRMNPKNGPDYFLARTNCPAIIIEPEFINHKETIIELREQGCMAIASALIIAAGEL